jgi:hypothetical protein
MFCGALASNHPRKVSKDKAVVPFWGEGELPHPAIKRREATVKNFFFIRKI